MAEETKVTNEQTESTEENTENSTVETQVETKEEKVFKQGDLDKLASKVRSEEKRKLTEAQTSWISERKEIEEKVSGLEKILSEMLAADIDGLSDREKKFISKLDIVDQIEYLKEVSKEQSKVFVPSTPKAKQKQDDGTRKIKRFI